MIERMYVPAHFAMPEPEIAAMLTALRAADLITASKDGLIATFLPVEYDPQMNALLGHVARNNPHWRAAATAEAESMVIMHAADAYISPSWYPSKAEHGRVVPTWNYQTLHIYGTLTVHDETDWLRAVVTRLTERHEANSAQPWAVTDAPPEFIDGQLRAIVGLSLKITRIEAKSKLSQNRLPADQASVITALSAGGPRAAEVAASMRARPGAG